MKIVLAWDSFKGNMRSTEACEIASRAILELIPNADVISVPMADGGEGTVEAVIAATGGRIQTVSVTGPLGDPVDGTIGVLPGNQTAVIEMASASGLELIPDGRLAPLETTTFGTGELIRAAMDMGIRDIILGIGGSATVDGGAGMAQALGYGLRTASGDEIGYGGGALENLAHVDVSQVDPRLKQTRIRVACDVTNPLLGDFGAASVFGPQKGATPQMVETLEEGLGNLSVHWKVANLLRRVDQPGDGAAGGLGAGLRAFCGGEIVSGAALVAEITGLAMHMRSADFVITGEGRTDAQTASGKLCSVVADMGRDASVPVILVSGALDGHLPALLDTFSAAYSISPGAISLEKALARSRDNLFFTVQSIVNTIRGAQSGSRPGRYP